MYCKKAQEQRFPLDEDTGGGSPRITGYRLITGTIFQAIILLASLVIFSSVAVRAENIAQSAGPVASAQPWHEIITPWVITTSLFLVFCSFFFSSCEAAFLSLSKVQLRAFRESAFWLHALTARLLEKPASLLTTILMGNTIVNVLLSISLSGPVTLFMQKTLLLSGTAAYLITVIITTGVLLFFCESLPKILAVAHPRTFAIAAAMPIYSIEILMTPFRLLSMALVGYLFKITRLSQVPPAVFLTDEEFKILLSEGEAAGAIEEDERQMIQGILEFQDVTLREILSPRPDIVAIKESATVREALGIVREHEYSRMPVYKDSLDRICGILYAKDLLPVTEDGDQDTPVTQYMRQAHFVPETMIVSDFVSMAQRSHIHIAMVVDEYGGTEGLVTLQDALREVVGDIGEEDDVEPPLCVDGPDNSKILAGNFPLPEFAEMMGLTLKDEEHTTLGGFLQSLSETILEVGDSLNYDNLCFHIEEINKQRITLVRVTQPVSVESEE